MSEEKQVVEVAEEDGVKGEAEAVDETKKHGRGTLAALNLEEIPQLVGTVARERAEEIFALMKTTRWPIAFVGPAGSGKTIMAMNLAKIYVLRVLQPLYGADTPPAYYISLSPDQTKTSVILGLRLINGSMQVVKGVVSVAMEQGSVMIIDEATHTSQEMLLMFNTIMDRTSMTSIGDALVQAKDSFRVIFCMNGGNYSGNIRLPQSFANRLAAWNFDYPTAEDEAQIALKIAQSEFGGKFDVPLSVVKYITSFVRETRTENYPLSARNIAIAVIRCALAKKSLRDEMSDYFNSGSSAESTKRMFATRILGAPPESVTSLHHPDVVDFVKYVSKIGVDKFREIVMSAVMYHLSVDGSELNSGKVHEGIRSSII